MAAKLEAREVTNRVRRTEERLRHWRKRAELWQCMYDREYWGTDKWPQTETTDHINANKECFRLRTTNYPRTAARLAGQLMKEHPQIEAHMPVGNVEEERNAIARSKFLRYSWQSQIKLQQTNPFKILKSDLNVLGKCMAKVVWLPEGERITSDCPILIEPIYPLCGGVEWGKTGPLWAYHKYVCQSLDVKVRYPSADIEQEDDKDVEVTDFYYVCLAKGRMRGRIYHCVMVDEEFIKNPVVTDYQQIPIFETVGDPDTSKDPMDRANSIFANTEEDWADSNLIESLKMTALEYDFWPHQFFESEYGNSVPDIEEGVMAPGGMTVLPPGVKIVKEAMKQANISLAQSVEGMIQQSITQATFANVLFGDASGVQSGFGVNALMTATSTRIQPNIDQLERMIVCVNSHVLQLVEEFAGPKGVTLYGYNQSDRKPDFATLAPEQIDGFYENFVKLSHMVPGDELNRMAMALQMVNAGIISRRTARQDYAIEETRDDEEQRILIEGVMNDPNVLRDFTREAYLSWYGVELAPGEPDGQDTPPPQPIQQQAPQGIQPQQAIPGASLPPELQGQLTPEAFNQIRQTNPALFQQLLGNQVGPETLRQANNGTLNT